MEDIKYWLEQYKINKEDLKNSVPQSEQPLPPLQASNQQLDQPIKILPESNIALQKSNPILPNSIDLIPPDVPISRNEVIPQEQDLFKPSHITKELLNIGVIGQEKSGTPLIKINPNDIVPTPQNQDYGSIVGEALKTIPRAIIGTGLLAAKALQAGLLDTPQAIADVFGYEIPSLKEIKDFLALHYTEEFLNPPPDKKFDPNSTYDQIAEMIRRKPMEGLVGKAVQFGGELLETAAPLALGAIHPAAPITAFVGSTVDDVYNKAISKGYSPSESLGLASIPAGIEAYLMSKMGKAAKVTDTILKRIIPFLNKPINTSVNSLSDVVVKSAWKELPAHTISDTIMFQILGAAKEGAKTSLGLGEEGVTTSQVISHILTDPYGWMHSFASGLMFAGAGAYRKLNISKKALEAITKNIDKTTLKLSPEFEAQARKSIEDWDSLSEPQKVDVLYTLLNHNNQTVRETAWKMLTDMVNLEKNIGKEKAELLYRYVLEDIINNKPIDTTIPIDEYLHRKITETTLAEEPLKLTYTPPNLPPSILPEKQPPDIYDLNRDITTTAPPEMPSYANEPVARMPLRDRFEQRFKSFFDKNPIRPFEEGDLITAKLNNKEIKPEFFHIGLNEFVPYVKLEDNILYFPVAFRYDTKDSKFRMVRFSDEKVIEGIEFDSLEDIKNFMNLYFSKFDRKPERKTPEQQKALPEGFTLKHPEPKPPVEEVEEINKPPKVSKRQLAIQFPEEPKPPIPMEEQLYLEHPISERPKINPKDIETKDIVSVKTIVPYKDSEGKVKKKEAILDNLIVKAINRDRSGKISSFTVKDDKNNILNIKPNEIIKHTKGEKAKKGNVIDEKQLKLPFEQEVIQEQIRLTKKPYGLSNVVDVKYKGEDGKDYVITNMIIDRIRKDRGTIYVSNKNRTLIIKPDAIIKNHGRIEDLGGKKPPSKVYELSKYEELQKKKEVKPIIPEKQPEKETPEFKIGDKILAKTAVIGEPKELIIVGIEKLPKGFVYIAKDANGVEHDIYKEFIVKKLGEAPKGKKKLKEIFKEEQAKESNVLVTEDELKALSKKLKNKFTSNPVLDPEVWEFFVKSTAYYLERGMRNVKALIRSVVRYLKEQEFDLAKAVPVYLDNFKRAYKEAVSKLLEVEGKSLKEKKEIRSSLYSAMNEMVAELSKDKKALLSELLDEIESGIKIENSKDKKIMFLRSQDIKNEKGESTLPKDAIGVELTKEIQDKILSKIVKPFSDYEPKEVIYGTFLSSDAVSDVFPEVIVVARKDKPELADLFVLTKLRNKLAYVKPLEKYIRHFRKDLEEVFDIEKSPKLLRPDFILDNINKLTKIPSDESIRRTIASGESMVELFSYNKGKKEPPYMKTIQRLWGTLFQASEIYPIKEGDSRIDPYIKFKVKKFMSSSYKDQYLEKLKREVDSPTINLVKLPKEQVNELELLTMPLQNIIRRNLKYMEEELNYLGYLNKTLGEIENLKIDPAIRDKYKTYILGAMNEWYNQNQLLDIYKLITRELQQDKRLIKDYISFIKELYRVEGEKITREEIYRLLKEEKDSFSDFYEEVFDFIIDKYYRVKESRNIFGDYILEKKEGVEIKDRFLQVFDKHIKDYVKYQGRLQNFQDFYNKVLDTYLVRFTEKYKNNEKGLFNYEKLEHLSPVVVRAEETKRFTASDLALGKLDDILDTYLNLSPLFIANYEAKKEVGIDLLSSSPTRKTGFEVSIGDVVTLKSGKEVEVIRINTDGTFVGKQKKGKEIVFDKATIKEEEKHFEFDTEEPSTTKELLGITKTSLNRLLESNLVSNELILEIKNKGFNEVYNDPDRLANILNKLISNELFLLDSIKKYGKENVINKDPELAEAFELQRAIRSTLKGANDAKLIQYMNRRILHNLFKFPDVDLSEAISVSKKLLEAAKEYQGSFDKFLDEGIIVYKILKQHEDGSLDIESATQGIYRHIKPSTLVKNRFVFLPLDSLYSGEFGDFYLSTKPFTRRLKPTEGITKEYLDKYVNLRRSVEGLIFVDTINDLPIHLYNKVMRDGLYDQVEAIYDSKSDTIFMVRSNLSVDRVLPVLKHEVIHRGSLRLFEYNLDSTSKLLLNKLKEKFGIYDKVSFYERLSELGETLEKDSVFNRLKSSLKLTINKILNIDFNLSDKDITFILGRILEKGNKSIDSIPFNKQKGSILFSLKKDFNEVKKEIASWEIPIAEYNTDSFKYYAFNYLQKHSFINKYKRLKDLANKKVDLTTYEKELKTLLLDHVKENISNLLTRENLSKHSMYYDAYFKGIPLIELYNKIKEINPAQANMLKYITRDLKDYSEFTKHIEVDINNIYRVLNTFGINNPFSYEIVYNILKKKPIFDENTLTFKLIDRNQKTISDFTNLNMDILKQVYENPKSPNPYLDYLELESAYNKKKSFEFLDSILNFALRNEEYTPVKLKEYNDTFVLIDIDFHLSRFFGKREYVIDLIQSLSSINKAWCTQYRRNAEGYHDSTDGMTFFYNKYTNSPEIAIVYKEFKKFTSAEVDGDRPSQEVRQQYFDLVSKFLLERNVLIIENTHNAIAKYYYDNYVKDKVPEKYKNADLYLRYYFDVVPQTASFDAEEGPLYARDLIKRKASQFLSVRITNTDLYLKDFFLTKLKNIGLKEKKDQTRMLPPDWSNLSYYENALYNKYFREIQNSYLGLFKEMMDKSLNKPYFTILDSFFIELSIDYLKNSPNTKSKKYIDYLKFFIDKTKYLVNNKSIDYYALSDIYNFFLDSPVSLFEEYGRIWVDLDFNYIKDIVNITKKINEGAINKVYEEDNKVLGYSRHPHGVVLFLNAKEIETINRKNLISALNAKQDLMSIYIKFFNYEDTSIGEQKYTEFFKELGKSLLEKKVRIFINNLSKNFSYYRVKDNILYTKDVANLPRNVFLHNLTSRVKSLSQTDDPDYVSGYATNLKVNNPNVDTIVLNHNFLNMLKNTHPFDKKIYSAINGNLEYVFIDNVKDTKVNVVFKDNTVTLIPDIYKYLATGGKIIDFVGYINNLTEFVINDKKVDSINVFIKEFKENRYEEEGYLGKQFSANIGFNVNFKEPKDKYSISLFADNKTKFDTANIIDNIVSFPFIFRGKENTISLEYNLNIKNTDQLHKFWLHINTKQDEISDKLYRFKPLKVNIYLNSPYELNINDLRIFYLLPTEKKIFNIYLKNIKAPIVAISENLNKVYSFEGNGYKLLYKSPELKDTTESSVAFYSAKGKAKVPYNYQYNGLGEVYEKLSSYQRDFLKEKRASDIEFLKNIARSFKTNPTLKKYEEDVELGELVRRIKEVPYGAMNWVDMISKDRYKDNDGRQLNEDQMRKLNLYVVAKDLLESIDEGVYTDKVKLGDRIEYISKQLPFGFKTRDEVAKFVEVAYEDLDTSTKQVLEKRQKLMDSILEELVTTGAVSSDLLEKKGKTYFHRLILASSDLMDEFLNLGIGEKLKYKRFGFTQERGGSSLPYLTDIRIADTAYLAQAKALIEYTKLIDLIRAKYDLSFAIKKNMEEIGIDPKNWKEYILSNEIKDKYGDRIVLFNLNKFKFLSKSADPEFLASELLENISNFLELPKNKRELLKEEIDMFMNKAQVLIAVPKRYAELFETISDIKKESHIGQLARALTNSFRKLHTYMPFKVLTWELRNTFGDIEAALRYPQILKYAKKATEDLYKRYVKKDPIPEGLQKELEALGFAGTIGTGFFSTELSNLGWFKFSELVNIEGGLTLGKLLKFSPAAWKELGTLYKDLVVFRESVLRLAAYRFFKDFLTKNPNTKIYGASKAELIDKLRSQGPKGIEMAAQVLSRDLIGDYGNISVFGQYMRNHLIPFYSFMEVNFRRYWRTLENLWKEDYIGFNKAATGVATLAKISMVYIAIQLWNKMFFPEEDKNLKTINPNYEYLIVGKSNNTLVLLPIQSVLKDFLDWFNLDNIDAYREMVSGIKENDPYKTTFALIKEPFGKVFSGMGLIKIPYELWAGKLAFPDIEKGTPIRDKSEYLLQQIGFEFPYIAAANLLGVYPIRQSQLFSKIFPYKVVDTFESDYNFSIKKIFDFLKTKKVEFPDIEPIEKTTALYYYKKAVKLGDEKAAKYWKIKYLEAGGTEHGIQISFRKSDPLTMIPIKYRHEFFNSYLTPEEKEKFIRARRWWLTEIVAKK